MFFFPGWNEHVQNIKVENLVHTFQLMTVFFLIRGGLKHRRSVYTDVWLKLVSPKSHTFFVCFFLAI